MHAAGLGSFQASRVNVCPLRNTLQQLPTNAMYAE